MTRTQKSHWVVDALDQHEQALIRYAKWLLGDLETARDVVQETFLRLCREDPRRVGERLAPWLFAVCRNLALDVRRKATRNSSLEDTDIAVPCDLDDRHDARRRLGQVLDVVETLPRNQREVIYLRFQGGLSYREISEVTGLSVSNVGFLLHTAVSAVRAQVGAQHARLTPGTTGAGRLTPGTTNTAPTGDIHEYSANQSPRPEVDRVRTRRTHGR